MPSDLHGLFYELIQTAVGARGKLSRVPTNKEWICLYEELEKQSIVGVMLDGIEELPPEMRPPKDMLLQWIGRSQMTEQNTNRIIEASEEAVNCFQENGFFFFIIARGRKMAFKRFVHNLRRDTHLINHYPQEIIFQPFFSLCLYFWRLSKGLL